mmetsp:Transcript_49237/g.154492  ORF Transcript_49237/g.154492 Transcript_49237/m.154492 type:complete len:538 (-) Transcript_49237:112-1725(-)
MSIFLRKLASNNKSPNFQSSQGVIGRHVRLEEHGNTVFCCAFSGESETHDIELATAAYDGTTRIWDVAKCTQNTSKKSKKILKGNSGGVWCCVYSSSSHVLVSGCSKGTLCAYSRGKYQILGRQDLAHGPNAVFSASMHDRSDVLATGGGDKRLKLWRVDDADSATPGISALSTLTGHSGDVVSCCFKPNTDLLVSGSEDRHIRVWDINSNECLQTLIGHTAEVCACSYDRDGSMLATASSDKTVRIWDSRQKNRCIQTISGHKASVYSCTFRKCSFDLLASASQDGSVAIWDPRNWKCCQVIRQHQGEVVGLAFHPHGTMLATGSADMAVNLYFVRNEGPQEADYVDFAGDWEKEEPTSPINGSSPQVPGSSSLRPASGPMVMEVATEFSPSIRPVDDELDPISSFNGRAQLGKQASVVRQMEAENAEDARLDLVSPDVRKELEDELALQQIILEQAMERKHRDGWKVRDADPEDVEELRVLLKKFYVEVNPTKLSRIEAIVQDYADRGGGPTEREALNMDLRAVYGVDLSSVASK